MSDNDLIRRGDALAEIELYRGEWSCSRDAIAYMPAAPAQPVAVQDAALVPEVKALIYAAKMVLHDHHHGNGLDGQYVNRDRLVAAISAIAGGDA